ncbi:MAG: hypothetical protein HQL70_09675 [Magnetococcales bacterium]|nr:hypothetical protein [Magnetococcales bacterium]
MKDISLEIYKDPQKCKVWHKKQEIGGLSSIDVNVRVNHPTRIALTLASFNAVKVSGDGFVQCGDPGTGEIKTVKRIEFQDGSVWEDK